MLRVADTAIGVDVGGTRIRVARIAQGGALGGTLQNRVSEPVRQDRDGFSAQIIRLINAARDDSSRAVGIGIPGRIDGTAQTIKSAGYLDIAGMDLPAMITRETGLPARIENDATMALLAEGYARPDGATGLIMMLTVGTGIGGAALENGAPWYGGGIAGQFGHIVVSADGPLCNCGRIGCVETLSSGTALGQLIAKAGLPDTSRAEDLHTRASAGDHAATNLLNEWARPFLRAIETLVSVADPRLVIIGGGLGVDMTRALERLPKQDKWFNLPIEAALLGDDAGVIGAGLCALAAHAPTKAE
ncbi:ROK family protein [Pararhizobium sp. IMCC21322]|uniref:ROK family protein n=1 Tax=Pararhizobium sp. IMCC21322 TaxID=3067903 RepID=UPI002740A6C6|nr:ROK family protein [Pararhizobium sp. IMCC21322]